MSIKYANTTKLFYKKWIYKVECWEFNWIYYMDSNRNRNFFPKVTKDVLVEYQKWREFLINNYEVQIRREGGQQVTFYFNDQTLIDQLDQSKPWVRRIFQPKNQEEIQALLNGNQTIKLCDRYYQGKYRYKVYTSNKLNVSEREKFIKWAAEYPDQRVLITGANLTWFDGARPGYLDTPYFYVLDELTLTMVNLFLGNHIKQNEKYVLRSSINTLNTEPKEILNDSVQQVL